MRSAATAKSPCAIVLRIGHQHQVRLVLARQAARERLAQTGVRILHPHVAVQHQERLDAHRAQQRQRAKNATAGFKWLGDFLAVGNLQPVPRTIAERRRNLFPQPRDIDDDLVEARRGKRAQVMLDQGLPADLEQRLWTREREGAHALALPRREDHRPQCESPSSFATTAGSTRWPISWPSSTKSACRLQEFTAYCSVRGMSARYPGLPSR